MFFVLMIRRPPSTTHPYTLFPYTTLVRSVGGDALVAERRLRPVERHRDRLRRVVAQEVHEHRREPEDGVGDLPRRGGEVGREREEGAVGERVAVDQQDGAGHRRSVGGELAGDDLLGNRSEEHTSELQSLMRISYAVFCLKKNKSDQYTRQLPQYIYI